MNQQVKEYLERDFQDLHDRVKKVKEMVDNWTKLGYWSAWNENPYMQDGARSLVSEVEFFAEDIANVDKKEAKNMVAILDSLYENILKDTPIDLTYFWRTYDRISELVEKEAKSEKKEVKKMKREYTEQQVWKNIAKKYDMYINEIIVENGEEYPILIMFKNGVNVLSVEGEAGAYDFDGYVAYKNLSEMKQCLKNLELGGYEISDNIDDVIHTLVKTAFKENREMAQSEFMSYAHQYMAKNFDKVEIMAYEQFMSTFNDFYDACYQDYDELQEKHKEVKEQEAPKTHADNMVKKASEIVSNYEQGQELADCYKEARQFAEGYAKGGEISQLIESAKEAHRSLKNGDLRKSVVLEMVREFENIEAREKGSKEASQKIDEYVENTLHELEEYANNTAYKPYKLQFASYYMGLTKKEKDYYIKKGYGDILENALKEALLKKEQREKRIQERGDKADRVSLGIEENDNIKEVISDKIESLVFELESGKDRIEVYDKARTFISNYAFRVSPKVLNENIQLILDNLSKQKENLLDVCNRMDYLLAMRGMLLYQKQEAEKQQAKKQEAEKEKLLEGSSFEVVAGDQPLKVLECFGGIGADRQALENLGVTVDADYVEIDKKAVSSYNALFNESHAPMDIKEFHPIRSYDLLVFGSPCQDLSIIGSQKGMINSERSSLMWEIPRILKETNEKGLALPQCIIWENVPNILAKRYKEDLERYFQEFKALGYSISYNILNTLDFGIPQDRKRFYSVMKLNNEPFIFDELKKRPMAFLEGLKDESYRKAHVITQPSMLRRINQGNRSGLSRDLKILDKSTYTNTLTLKQMRAPNSGIWKCKEGYRYLTEKECFLLQGFPLYKFERLLKLHLKRKDQLCNTIYKQCGNSFSVPVIQAILEKVDL